MKKVLLIAGFFLIGITAQSQVLISLLLGDKLNSENLEFGLETGVNWSSISGMDTSSSLTSWNIGFYFDFRLKKQWFLYTGVLVKSKLGIDDLTENDLQLLNTTIYTENGDYSQKINYFIVPALAKYKFDNNIYLEAGPQFGLMHKAWIEFNSDTDGREARIKESNKDDINRFDAGLTVGAGYTLFKGNGMTLGAKYYFGLTDVYKNISGTRNSAFFLKVNIPVGGVKSKDEKQTEITTQ